MSSSITSFVSRKSSRVKTYSVRCTPDLRVSFARRSTLNPNEAHVSLTTSSDMPPKPPRRFLLTFVASVSSGTTRRSHTATRPFFFSARLARTSNASSIDAGVASFPGPTPVARRPAATERTPYGKSVTIASTAFSNPPYASETRGSSRSDAFANATVTSTDARVVVSERKKRVAASLAASSALSSTSQPSTLVAPSAAAAKATAPPPTHGSTTKSPGLTRAAFAASIACSGGIAFGASMARKRVLESAPHAATSPNMPSGYT